MAKWWGQVLYRRPRILGDAWWECAARRKGERATGRVAVEMGSDWALARVVFQRDLAPPPAAEDSGGEVSLRCFFLGDGANWRM